MSIYMYALHECPLFPNIAKPFLNENANVLHTVFHDHDDVES